LRRRRRRLVFERFTDRARRVVVLAQEEARLLNHGYLGTEHLVLGLISEGTGRSRQVLIELGADLDSFRSEVEEIVGKGTGIVRGHIPFTPRAKKVMEFALRESLQLGHNYIGTEHLLLGLIREGEGVGSQVLMKRGLELSVVREAVITALNGRQPQAKLKPVPEDRGRLFVLVRELQVRGEVATKYEHSLNDVVKAIYQPSIHLEFKDGTEVYYNERYIEQWWTEKR
jgi:ATP-dependent Clp protease ATP-binding subunit ClpA